MWGHVETRSQVYDFLMFAFDLLRDEEMWWCPTDVYGMQLCHWDTSDLIFWLHIHFALCCDTEGTRLIKTASCHIGKQRNRLMTHFLFQRQPRTQRHPKTQKPVQELDSYRKTRVQFPMSLRRSGMFHNQQVQTCCWMKWHSAWDTSSYAESIHPQSACKHYSLLSNSEGQRDMNDSISRVCR